MQPQQSVWGNINLCIEIALNMYYIWGDQGEGIAISREKAEKEFSNSTVQAGREKDGYLFYGKGDTMGLPAYELLQKRIAFAKQVERQAMEQMDSLLSSEKVTVQDYFSQLEMPGNCQGEDIVRNGISFTSDEPAMFVMHRKIADTFLSPYACEFAEKSGDYLYYSVEGSAIPLNELREIFPECRDLVVSEDSMFASISRNYPAYMEQYNRVMPKEAQIPQTEAPDNLFLQKQLDRAGRADIWETEEEASIYGENESDEFGEEVEYGYEPT